MGTEIVNWGNPGKDLGCRVATNLLCNWRFWKQPNGYKVAIVIYTKTSSHCGPALNKYILALR